MYDLIVVPLLHISLPVIALSAYSTAGVPAPPVAAGLPDETAKATSLTMTVVAGAPSARDVVQPGYNVGLPPWSTIFQATTEFFVGASSHA